MVRLPQPRGISTAILMKAGCTHGSSAAPIAPPKAPPTPMSPPPPSLVPSLSPTPPCSHHVHAFMFTKYWRRNAKMEAGMVGQCASPSTDNSTVPACSRLGSSSTASTLSISSSQPTSSSNLQRIQPVGSRVGHLGLQRRRPGTPGLHTCGL